MGRFLKDGEFKPKPSAMKKAERMQGPIEFQDTLRRFTQVKVFMGAGWEKATVLEWTKHRVTVRTARGQKTVVCHDARNLEVL